MKSLKESILTNSRIGVSSLIENWFKSVRDDLPFRVEKHNEKWFVIVDDFASQPRQVSVVITDDLFTNMPKQLCGIYKTKYKSKSNNGELEPFKLIFKHIKNKTIDLSYWDMSLGKVSSLYTHIEFNTLNNVSIIGLPKYGVRANIVFDDVNNDMLSVKGDYSLSTGIFGYLNIDKIKNCDIPTIYVNKQTILNNANNASSIFYVDDNKILLYTKYNSILNDLLKHNKIKNILYVEFNYNDTIKNGTYKLVYKNNQWIAEKI